jgi:hypothetical protein
VSCCWYGAYRSSSRRGGRACSRSLPRNRRAPCRRPRSGGFHEPRRCHRASGLAYRSVRRSGRARSRPSSPRWPDPALSRWSRNRPATAIAAVAPAFPLRSWYPKGGRGALLGHVRSPCSWHGACAENRYCDAPARRDDSAGRSPRALDECRQTVLEFRRKRLRKTTKSPRARALRGPRHEKSRRRPTLPGGLPPSTIGAGGLNCRVRNGNGCIPAAMATGNRALGGSPTPPFCGSGVRACGCVTATPERPKASTSSKSQALGRLVPVG